MVKASSIKEGYLPIHCDFMTGEIKCRSNRHKEKICRKKDKKSSYTKQMENK